MTNTYAQLTRGEVITYDFLQNPHFMNNKGKVPKNKTAPYLFY